MSACTGIFLFLFDLIHQLVSLLDDLIERITLADHRDIAAKACRDLIRLVYDVVYAVQVSLKTSRQQVGGIVSCICVEENKLVSAETRAYSVGAAAFLDNECKPLNSEISLVMTVVVVDVFQSVHVNESQHDLSLLSNAGLENVVCDLDKAVSVVDVAERIYNVYLVQFVHRLVDVSELPQIFDRIADVHGERVAKQAVYREIAVVDDVISEHLIAEMQREEVIDISACLLRYREHIAAAEILHRGDLAVFPDQRRCHDIENKLIGSGSVIGILPVIYQAESESLTSQSAYELLDNIEVLFGSFRFRKIGGEAVQGTYIGVDSFQLIVGDFAELAEILLPIQTASAAFRE